MVPIIFITVCMFLGTTVLWEGSSVVEVFNIVDSGYIVVILYLALIPGIFGILLVIYPMKWLPPMLIGCALLFEPIIATVLMVALQVEPTPDYFTWCGAAVALFGFFCITVGYDQSRPLSWVEESILSVKLHDNIIVRFKKEGRVQWMN